MSVFRGRIVTVDVEDAELPNGARLSMEIVHHPGGAAIVALDAGGRVCLLRQYRHAVRDWLWELPAGKIEEGEPPLETARRELAEEAGVKAAQWESLGSVLTSPGVFTERVHLWLARHLEPMPRIAHDDEVFDIHWLPFGEALGRAMDGDFCDAKTVAALARAADRVR